MNRRNFLSSMAVSAAALASSGALAQQARGRLAQTIQSILPDGQPFEPGKLIEIVRQVAKAGFAAPAADLPEPFGALTFEQYTGIRAKPVSVLFSGADSAVNVEPLHRGFVYTRPVLLHVIEDGVVRRIPYDPNRFDFGRVTPPAQIDDIGFSGFRVFADPVDNALRQVAIVQGATFFRAAARGQNFGVMARALALKIAETRGEEVPNFRAVWIERPKPPNTSLVFHGLFDSESCTGLFRATIRPGDITIVDVETTVVTRATIDHIGMGAQTATFLFGPNYRRNVDDVRPAVYEAEGLQMLNGRGEWIWRPISNRQTLQLSAFLDENPRGFGLVMRERAFSRFEDEDQHWEARPSLWIEPIGDWGPGVVALVEIPSESEVNDNILAYWRPRDPIKEGSEVTFAYRQFWCWNPPEKPPLATVSATRVGRGAGPRRRRFLIDLSGDIFAAPGKLLELKPVLAASTGTISALRVLPYPERKACRVSFELDPGSEISCELRFLFEADGKPASETWLYRWTP